MRNTFTTKHTNGSHQAFWEDDGQPCLSPSFGTEIELVEHLGKIGIDLRRYDGKGIKPEGGAWYDVVTTWKHKSRA